MKQIAVARQHGSVSQPVSLTFLGELLDVALLDFA